jgi:hypothetical protein
MSTVERALAEHRTMTSHRRPNWKSPWFVPVLVLSGVLVYVGIAAYQAVWLFGCKMASANGLQQIMMAMQNYRQTNGCYPPQFLADNEGRPAHSWRVLIWPYVCGDDSHRRYRFDEPWNGPHNRLLAAETPACFCSPNVDPKSKSGTTDYVGIVGKDTLWRGTVPLRWEDLAPLKRRLWKETQGLGPYADTGIVWFVEAANTGINWMEPRDIPLEQALVGINVPGGIQSFYSDVLPAWKMILDCSGYVPAGISPDAFRKMLTIPGGKEREAIGR